MALRFGRREVGVLLRDGAECKCPSRGVEMKSWPARTAHAIGAGRLYSGAEFCGLRTAGRGC